MLADDECPLLAQLNWTKGDAVFVLKNERNKLRVRVTKRCDLDFPFYWFALTRDQMICICVQVYMCECGVCIQLDKAVIKELCQQQLKPGASGKVKDKQQPVMGVGDGGRTLQRTPSKKSAAAAGTPSDITTPFSRSSSNPDSVTQHRRQQQKVQFTDNFNPGVCIC